MQYKSAYNWTVSQPGESISLGMILKEEFTVPAGIGWFIFDWDSRVQFWLAHFVRATDKQANWVGC